MTSSEIGALMIPFDGVLPRIAAGVFIAPGAVLIGDVEIAEGASVWFGVVLRGDDGPIRIGRNSNVQDGSVLHPGRRWPVILGAGVTVGHRAVVHGATIEDDVLIGMGAVVLNGSVIGSGSVIAAGAVVREGDVIAPRSLVAGVPGRVMRAVDDTGHERVRNNSAVYVELSRRYLSAGEASATTPR